MCRANKRLRTLGDYEALETIPRSAARHSVQTLLGSMYPHKVNGSTGSPQVVHR